jgi:hypothetical protein
MYYSESLRMKKLICIIALAISTTACAGPHGHRSGPHGGWGTWVAPLAIGGLIGYGMSQRPVQIIPQHGIIYQSPIPSTPPMQPVYQEVIVYQSDCNCYQKQYRQIGWQ